MSGKYQNLKWSQWNMGMPRLNYPARGDVHYFGRLGKKHYPYLNNRSDLHIVNLINHQTALDEKYQTLKKSNHENDLSLSNSRIFERNGTSSINPEQDSLQLLEKDYKLKKQFRHSPMISMQIKDKKYVGSHKNAKGNDLNRNEGSSFVNIFQPIDYMHKVVENSKNKSMLLKDKKQRIIPQFERSRTISPTYISSKFEAA